MHLDCNFLATLFPDDLGTAKEWTRSHTATWISNASGVNWMRWPALV
jgi:hypothetical protein